jgi:hypothetical protein
MVSIKPVVTSFLRFAMIALTPAANFPPVSLTQVETGGNMLPVSNDASRKLPPVSIAVYCTVQYCTVQYCTVPTKTTVTDKKVKKCKLLLNSV